MNDKLDSKVYVSVMLSEFAEEVSQGCVCRKEGPPV